MKKVVKFSAVQQFAQIYVDGELVCSVANCKAASLYGNVYIMKLKGEPITTVYDAVVEKIEEKEVTND